MGNTVTNQHTQSRMMSARLDILRRELLAPIRSIEEYAKSLREYLDDSICLEDLDKIELASGHTRSLIYETLKAEAADQDETVRDKQRSVYIHDLRNSIGPIRWYSEIILETLEDSETPSGNQHVYLNHLIKESTKLLEMFKTMFL